MFLFEDLILIEEEITQLTLFEIENYLQANIRSLSDFGSISKPKGYVLEQLGNRLFYEENNYDKCILKEEYINNFKYLTTNNKTTLFFAQILIKCI